MPLRREEVRAALSAFPLRRGKLRAGRSAFALRRAKLPAAWSAFALRRGEVRAGQSAFALRREEVRAALSAFALRRAKLPAAWSVFGRPPRGDRISGSPWLETAAPSRVNFRQIQGGGYLKPKYKNDRPGGRYDGKRYSDFTKDKAGKTKSTDSVRICALCIHCGLFCFVRSSRKQMLFR